MNGKLNIRRESITNTYSKKRLKWWLDKDTVKLLRIPFSYFLMPVFLFATGRAEVIEWWRVLLVFLSLHLFIYPASNGYNSYIDRDETAIGGLENPPMPTRNLFYASLLFDIIGLSIAYIVDIRFFVLLVAYMLASRAYSSPQIRLKKYPIIGFLTVMLFQGGLTFSFVYYGVSGYAKDLLFTHWAAIAGSSLLIAGVYPLTQIYQHEEDEESGDKTLSIMLGYRGTFIFSLVMFVLAAICLYVEFMRSDELYLFFIFLAFLLPVVLYFNRWMLQVWKDTDAADFKNTMRMNMIAATCMNLAFITMIILKHII